MPTNPWRIESQPESSRAECTALLESPDSALRMRLEVSRPQSGTCNLRWGDRELGDWRLLAPQLIRSDEPALQLVECYIRGADLIATYDHQRGPDVHSQIYWRCLRQHNGGQPGSGLELIISVQTDLLYSEPRLTVVSELPAAEVGRLMREDESSFAFLDPALNRVVCTRDDGLSVFVVRPRDADFSYVQMVHPSDFHETVLERHNGKLLLTHDLFPDPLEKGVIRRGRVRGWFVDRADDLHLAWECYRGWLAEPPPLTT